MMRCSLRPDLYAETRYILHQRFIYLHCTEMGYSDDAVLLRNFLLLPPM